MVICCAIRCNGKAADGARYVDRCSAVQSLRGEASDRNRHEEGQSGKGVCGLVTQVRGGFGRGGES